jgi:drug/metabolite transporter (DMT)-like permease
MRPEVFLLSKCTIEGPGCCNSPSLLFHVRITYFAYITYYFRLQTELSLTVPITNSLAFLFTVLGEWYVDGKIISKDTWLGMALVCAGIGMCVVSKT